MKKGMVIFFLLFVLFSSSACIIQSYPNDEGLREFHIGLENMDSVLIIKDPLMDEMFSIYFEIKFADDYYVNILNTNDNLGDFLNQQYILNLLNNLVIKKRIKNYPLDRYIYMVEYNGIRREYKMNVYNQEIRSSSSPTDE